MCFPTCNCREEPFSRLLPAYECEAREEEIHGRDKSVWAGTQTAVHLELEGTVRCTGRLCHAGLRGTGEDAALYP